MPDAIASSATELAGANVSRASRVRQFYVLTKPRVVQLIVFCAVIGMLLAVPGMPTRDEALKALQPVSGSGWWLARPPPSIA
jgi:protoheme IX farnesyltransferase